MKNDGFQVVWSKQSGDATVSTLLARFKGMKVKLLQVRGRSLGTQEVGTFSGTGSDA